MKGLLRKCPRSPKHFMSSLLITSQFTSLHLRKVPPQFPVFIFRPQITRVLQHKVTLGAAPLPPRNLTLVNEGLVRDPFPFQPLHPQIPKKTIYILFAYQKMGKKNRFALQGTSIFPTNRHFWVDDFIYVSFSRLVGFVIVSWRVTTLNNPYLLILPTTVDGSEILHHMWCTKKTEIAR